MEIAERAYYTDDFRNGYVVTTPGSMANPTVAYTTVDGWHQYIPNSGSAITAENRSVVVTIPTDGAIKLSYEAKINSISGDATSKVGLYGAVGQQIYDLETGKLVGEGNTFNWEIGKWYKIVTYKSDNGNLGTKYTFGYAGDAAHNAGNASVSFRNFEAIYPEKLEVSFSLNYEGATGAPATIKVAEGGAYGNLPTPTRDGYTFGGWYTDAACTGSAVTASTTVSASHTLYAKWESGDPIIEEAEEEEENGGFGILLLILALGLAAVAAVVAFLLLSKKTVKFETRCRKKIKDQKVKKGSFLERPEQPKRPDRTFAGWYLDEECTERWDFETDTVEQSMTLYAKWI
jgi:uncharacterized repeat protein (TIGR02543 family)